MVQLSVRMIDTEGMFVGRNIVAKHQIKLVILPAPAGNGGNGVVGRVIRMSDDKGGSVRIAPPAAENFVSQFNKPLLLCTVQTDNAHRPLHNAGLHIVKFREV